MHRTTWVSIVSWAFIIVCGLGSVFEFMANVTLHFIGPEMSLIMQVPLPANASWFTTFVVTHLKLIAAINLVIFIVSFVTSIALLLRKNWARRFFIWLMMLGVAWNLASLFSLVTRYITRVTNSPVAHAQASFDSETNAVLFAVCLCIVFTWIAIRLSRPQLDEEFQKEP